MKQSGAQAPATTPTIYNVTMTLADTQYSQALPTKTKKCTLRTRDGTAFRLAYETGKVAAPTEPYFTIPANAVKSEDNLSTSVTLYFACAAAAKVIEIEAWQ